MCEFEKVVAVEEGVRVIHIGYRGVWPVAARDMVVVRRIFEEGPGKVYIPSRSLARVLEGAAGTVRMHVELGGFIVEQREQGVRLTIVSDSDMMGSVPGLVKDQVTKSQGGLPY
jgi:hypothetical protein